MDIGVISRGPGNAAAVTISADDVAEFARRWPCFGKPRRIYAAWDSRGDLVELENDEGLDSAGVGALLDDVRAVLFPDRESGHA